MEVLRDKSPWSQGRFVTQPRYLVVHGSRSGKAHYSMRQEFNGTRNYAKTRNDGIGWHATLGEDAYSIHIPPDEWGQHAGNVNAISLGVECSQAVVDWDMPDSVIRSLVHWLRFVVLPVWPEFNVAADNVMVMHSEVPQGIRDGKSDLFPRGDRRWPDFKARVIAELGGVGRPGTGNSGGAPVPTPEEDEQRPNRLFDAYVRGLPAGARNLLGPPRYRANLFGRAHWGAAGLPLLRMERGLLVVVDGEVVNVTGRALDDWETENKRIIQRF